jgi:hypothetical protein
VFFCNEAWFSLHGDVKCQNSQYWSAEDTGLFHELPLHDEKIGVSCAMDHAVRFQQFPNKNSRD